MNRDRLWVIGSIAGIIVIAVLGWFVGVSPVVTQAAAAADQANVLNQTNVASQARLTTLKAQFANLPKLQTDLSVLRQSIPTGADLSTFITEINDYCARYNVELTSVIVNDATVYTAPVAPVAPTTNADGTTATPTPTPTPTVAAGATTTPVAPASNAGALVMIPVIINVNGSFSNLMQFTGAVQKGPRLYLANEVAAVPGDNTSGPLQYAGTLTGFVYSLAGTSGDLPASATPVTPVVPTPTPTPTSIPTVGATAPPTTAPSSTPKP
jgi:Tfp pilus assembly protein PilO